jgi:hypothetical protein
MTMTNGEAAGAEELTVGVEGSAESSLNGNAFKKTSWSVEPSPTDVCSFTAVLVSEVALKANKT